MHRAWLGEAVDLASDAELPQARALLLQALLAAESATPRDLSALFCAHKDIALVSLLQRQPADAFQHVCSALAVSDECLGNVEKLPPVLSNTLRLLCELRTKLDPANAPSAPSGESSAQPAAAAGSADDVPVAAMQPESLATITPARHLQLVNEELAAVDDSVKAVLCRSSDALVTR